MSIGSTGGPREALALKAQQAFKQYQSQADGMVAAKPEAFKAFVNDTAKALGIAPAEFLKLIEPYNAMPPELSQKLIGGLNDMAAKYLVARAPTAATPAQTAPAPAPTAAPPAPPAPPPKPPLPPKEKGFLDRMLSKVEELGSKAVDGLESLAEAPTQMLADATKDIPVLGSITKAVAAEQKFGAEIMGGILKGAGTLVDGVATMIVHPVDTAMGLEKLAEHIPMVPANPFRMAHAAWDIAVEGKPMAETLRKNLDPTITMQEDYEFGKTLVKAVVEPYKQAIDEGKYGEAVGRGIFDIGSLVLTGGGSAAAETGIEGAAIVSRVARAAEVAEVASDASRLAKAGELAADAGRAAKAGELAADAGRAAKAGEAAADAGRAAKAGEAASDAGRASKAGEAASDAGRATKAGEAAGDAGRAAEALPAPLREATERARAIMRDAVGDLKPDGLGPAAQKAREQVMNYLDYSGLDEAGKAKLMKNIEENAAKLGRDVPAEGRKFGEVTSLKQVEGAEEVLEHLAQSNPQALKDMYAAINKAAGLDPEAVEKLINDYTHCSKDCNPLSQKLIGQASKLAMTEELPRAEQFAGAMKEIAKDYEEMMKKPPSPEALAEAEQQLKSYYGTIKQMQDTREVRQAMIKDVLGIDPPEAYRVFRGSSNPKSVARAAEAWAKDIKEVGAPNRGISSTSLDPVTAMDFSMGGPESITVDADFQAFKAGGEQGTFTRKPPKDTFVTYDMDIPNDQVVFDKYTDGGYSVHGDVAQRAQREVLVGGPQETLPADARRLQISYNGKTYMYEDRQALLDTIKQDLENGKIPAKDRPHYEKIFK